MTHHLYVDDGYVQRGYVNSGIWVDWATRVIFVPRGDTALIQSVPTEVRELDLNAFRLALKSIEDSEEGMAYPDTHRHVAPITVGGVQLARVVELINGYTVTFEDGQYAVNLTGANSNVGDRVNPNQVSVRVANSAGLVVVGGSIAPTASEVANAVWSHATAMSLVDKVEVARAILQNKTVTDPVTGIMTVYDADGVTPLLVAQLYEGVTTATPYRGAGAERRERLS